jgi:hypothetical protein
MLLRPRRRKLRVLLLRTLMRLFLTVRAHRRLRRLLLWTEYGVSAGAIEASRSSGA